MPDKTKVIVTIVKGKSRKQWRDTRIHIGEHRLYAKWSFLNSNELRLEFTANQFVIASHGFVGIEFLDKIVVGNTSINNFEFFEPMKTRIFYKGIEIALSDLTLALGHDNTLTILIPESYYEIEFENLSEKG